MIWPGCPYGAAGLFACIDGGGERWYNAPKGGGAMRWYKKGGTLGNILVLLLVLFIGLGFLSLKAPETAAKLPEFLKTAAEKSGELLTYLKNTVRPAGR